MASDFRKHIEYLKEHLHLDSMAVFLGVLQLAEHVHCLVKLRLGTVELEGQEVDQLRITVHWVYQWIYLKERVMSEV